MQADSAALCSDGIKTPAAAKATDAVANTESVANAATKCECGAPADDISFDRSICACGRMHYFCRQCGAQADGCDDAPEPAAAPVSYRTLSEPQKRHLREMVNEQGETRYWHPANQGERACAAKLKKLGLLDGSALTASDAYWLTEKGLKLGRGLKANPDV